MGWMLLSVTRVKFQNNYVQFHFIFALALPLVPRLDGYLPKTRQTSHTMGLPSEHHYLPVPQGGRGAQAWVEMLKITAHQRTGLSSCHRQAITTGHHLFTDYWRSSFLSLFLFCKSLGFTGLRSNPPFPSYFLRGIFISTGKPHGILNSIQIKSFYRQETFSHVQLVIPSVQHNSSCT